MKIGNGIGFFTFDNLILKPCSIQRINILKFLWVTSKSINNESKAFSG